MSFRKSGLTSERRRTSVRRARSRTQHSNPGVSHATPLRKLSSGQVGAARIWCASPFRSCGLSRQYEALHTLLRVPLGRIRDLR